MASQNLKLACLNGEPEIFHSIQGEGLSMGVPSVFVRTSLCNLHCIWCDTDYTWNWVGTPFLHVNDSKPAYKKFEQKEWLVTLPVAEVVERVKIFPCRNIILTGGEPMMQQKTLTALAQILRANDANYCFEVETNGTYLPIPEFAQIIDQFNVSPKLANSGNPEQRRDRPKPLRWFAASPKAIFKFVVAEVVDLQEVLQLLEKYSILASRVILMPEGTEASRLAERRAWLVEVCKSHGFRFSDRLHIQIWGAKKGV